MGPDQPTLAGLLPLVEDVALSLNVPSLPKLPALSGVLFELALDENGPPVGLAVRATANDTEELLRLATAPTRGRDSAWAAVGRLARARNADPRLKGAVGDLWLEFDLDGQPEAALQRPCVFAGLSRDAGRPPTRGPNAPRGQRRTVAVIAAVLEALGRHPPASLERVVAAMPASSRVSYVGAMLARGGDDSRLTFDSMPLDGSCTAMLAALGWGHGRELVPVLSLLVAIAPSAVLHLDLDPSGRVGNRLGFELAPGALRVSGLARMVTSERAETLAAWPRRRHRLVSPEAWPPAFRAWDHLSFGINHVKVVFEPGEPLRLKGYLAATWDRSIPSPALW